DEFVRKEWNREPHVGETPFSVIRDVTKFSRRARELMAAAAPLVSKNRSEFERWNNDIHCVDLMTAFYAEKVKAAELVLRHGYSKDIADMEKADVHMANSLEHFKALTRLTEKSYRFAN